MLSRSFAHWDIIWHLKYEVQYFATKKSFKYLIIHFTNHDTYISLYKQIPGADQFQDLLSKSVVNLILLCSCCNELKVTFITKQHAAAVA